MTDLPEGSIQPIDGVTEDEVDAFLATVKTSGSMWSDGFSAGLNAAREAVVGMYLPSGITYLVGTDRRDLAEMVRRAALDLIDALRGQPQDETSVQRSFEKSLDSDSTLTRAQVALLKKAAALTAIDALREEPMATGGMYSGPPVTLGDGCVIPKSGNKALEEKR